jgi:drug/metabolite transporter (DMT)-like permease
MWLLFALTSAFGLAGADIAKKKLAGRISHQFLAAAMHTVTAILLIPLVWTARQFAMPSIPAIAVTSVAAVLTIIAIHLQLSAMAQGELSLLEPLQELLPITVIIASFVINRELPKPLALSGIALIMTGLVLIRRHRHDRRILDPIRNLLSDPAVLTMVLAVILFGIATAFDKLSISLISPLLYVLLLNALMAIVEISHAVITGLELKRLKPKLWVWLLVLCLASVVLQVGQILAIQRAHAGNVIAIRDLGILLVVWYGGHKLHERRHWRQRWSAAIVISAGAILVAIAQGI